MTAAINYSAYAYPYVMLFAMCLFVLGVALWKYPSLRIYRKKRNMLVYTVLALVFSLIAYQAYNVSLGPNDISFGIEKTQTPIYPEQQNHFDVTCYSNGVREVHFYMVIKCANATLQADGQQDYIQLNGTAVKIPFTFNGNGEQTKPVYFTANPDATSLSFYPSIERQDDSPMLVTSYLSEIQCTWNQATHSYAMADSMPLAVP